MGGEEKSMNRVWVYDPGGTTGWALFRRTPTANQPATLIRWGECKLWHDIDKQIAPGDDVVYEKLYVLSPGFNPIGIEVVGVINYLCERARIVPHPQHPGILAGPYQWPGSKALHKIVRSDHAYDAILHGVVHLKYRGLDDVLPKNS